MAFMTEGSEPAVQQQAMLREFLKDNPNSLKEQSKKRQHPHREGVSIPLHEEDLLKAPQKGNPHGWGMAAYSSRTGDTVQIQRSLRPAFEDDRFDATAETLLQQSPQTLLAHILNKVDPKRTLNSEEDVHPFYLGNWSGMFNGVLDGGRTPAITDAVNNIHCPTLGCAPKGTNSGEKVLLYMLGKLKQQFGTIESASLPLKALQKAFSETLQDFIKQSQPVYRDLDGGVLGLKGKVQLGPSINYIVTDGRVLMAYRKGRKLYLNRHPAAHGKLGYLVSSEPIQPTGQKLTWMELPQDHILTLVKKPDGNIDASLTPMSVALSSVPS
jgi:predicted glutamine amidotransferase